MSDTENPFKRVRVAANTFLTCFRYQATNSFVAAGRIESSHRMNSMSGTENPFKRVRTTPQHVFNVFPVSGHEFIRGLGDCHSICQYGRGRNCALTEAQGEAILARGSIMGLTERICKKAHDIGFDLVGVAPARPTPHLEAYHAWLERGYHGEMGYMARPDRVERRADPSRILPGVRSVVCVGLNYYPGTLPAESERDPARGLISNYAWGLDYHDLMLSRLEELVAFIKAGPGSEVGRAIGCIPSATSRAYVDTGPVLERAYAAEAGLGFVGKNTCLIHPRMGSWLFLGEILLDIELDPTAAAGMETRPTGRPVRGDCGTCQRCLDACPTGALVAPRVLDARRCISYLTIELKGPIPHELRPLIGHWIYGCDVCQAACPWQRFARPTQETGFHAVELDRAAPLLSDVIAISEKTFRQRYANTPILRIGRRRLLRNAAVALGNWQDDRAIPILANALTDAEPLVRGHAAWALGRGGWKTSRMQTSGGARTARDMLTHALLREEDPYVQQEIRRALSAP